MPHDIRVIKVREFLRADVSGKMNLEQTVDLLVALASRNAAKPDQHILLDVRDTKEPELDSADLYELVKVLRSLGMGVINRMAILRNKREGFDRARFFQMLAHDRGLNVGVFEEFEECFEWIRLEGPVVQTG